MTYFAPPTSFMREAKNVLKIPKMKKFKIQKSGVTEKQMLWFLWIDLNCLKAVNH